SDHFDFYVHVLRQCCDLNCGTRRGIGFEVGTINFINDLEIAEVGEENRCFDYVVKSKSLSSQNRRDIVHHASSLNSNIAGNNLAGLWIQRDLTAAKNEVAAAHRLRVRSYRPGSFACGNNLLHAAILNADGCCAITATWQLALFADPVFDENLSHFRSGTPGTHPDRQRLLSHHA